MLSGYGLVKITEVSICSRSMPETQQRSSSLYRQTLGRYTGFGDQSDSDHHLVSTLGWLGLRPRPRRGRDPTDRSCTLCT